MKMAISPLSLLLLILIHLCVVTAASPKEDGFGFCSASSDDNDNDNDDDLLMLVSKVDRLECAYLFYHILPAIPNQSQIFWEIGNGYSQKDKNKAKTDKTEHGNRKSEENQSRKRIHSEYGISTAIGYGVSNFLSNTAYLFKFINTAYSLLFNTTYRSSDKNEKVTREFKKIKDVKIRGDDKVELTDEESSDDKDEVAEVFRIDTNLFNFETPMCKAFKEFNYLLQIDPDLLTNRPLRTYIIGNQLHYQDHKWYEALEDSELKDEALRNKAIMEGLINEGDDESRYEQERRWNIYTNYDDAYEDSEKEELCEVHELPVCNIRTYMMIKYSFNNDEKYVAVKEDEYNDLIITREEALLPERQPGLLFNFIEPVFPAINTGVSAPYQNGRPRERNIDEVGGMHIFWNSVCMFCVMLKIVQTTLLCWSGTSGERLQNDQPYLKNTIPEDQYAVSIKEDTAYHSCTRQRPQRNEAQYAVSRRCQYVVLKIYKRTKVIKGEFEKLKDLKVKDVFRSLVIHHLNMKLDDDIGYDPSDVVFTEWLGLKFFNYKTMDHYTMKALWIYWIRGDDEVKLTDENLLMIR
ncbi:hypothetical protein Tco_0261822 [Tanacetum coccineum]